MGDGNTAPTITAPLSRCTINFRPMPGQDKELLLHRVREAGKRFKVQVSIWDIGNPLWTAPTSRIVEAALEVTGKRKAKTVPYGTDGLVLGSHLELVILGPGSIKQAHAPGEWVDLSQLARAVDVYSNLIARFCL